MPVAHRGPALEDPLVSAMLFDDEAASLLERAYATTDMVLQREASRKSLRASSGESILDLGSGPGFLACEIAEEVGETGRVFAVDISSDMNSISATRAAAAGLSDRIEISEGDATALTFPDSAFDAAVSTQVIEYLADPDAALVELARVLRPGGRLVLIDTDFDSLVWAARIVTSLLGSRPLGMSICPIRTCRAPSSLDSARPGSIFKKSESCRFSTRNTTRRPSVTTWLL